MGIVSALEVVQLNLPVVDVAAVAQGVQVAQGVGEDAGGGVGVAPGIVGIVDQAVAYGVGDGDHVALNVGDVVIHRSVVGQGEGLSVRVVGKVQRVAATGHPGKLPAVIDVAVGIGAVGALCSHAVGIVGK